MVSLEDQTDTAVDQPGPSSSGMQHHTDQCERNDAPVSLLGDSEATNNEDDWICVYCKAPWDDDGEDRWIICDTCSAKFQLQCSGFTYKTSLYWYIDLDTVLF